MSNYLTTINGALVSNSAAAVLNKEEPNRELKEEVRGLTRPHGRQSQGVRADGSTALSCGLSTWHSGHELIYRSLFLQQQIITCCRNSSLEGLSKQLKQNGSRFCTSSFSFNLHHFK